MRQAQILLIEDTDSVREVITRQLEALGAIVTALADGDTVKRELDAKDYDLVIADLHLPNCSGFDIARFANAKKCKVVLLSGDTVAAGRDDFLTAQFDQILTKPVNLATLKNMLLHHGLLDDGGIDIANSNTAFAGDGTEAVNLAALEDQMGQLDDVALSMLAKFPSMMQPLVEQIADPAARQDLARVSQIAHSLKGAARSAGALILGDVSAKIQELAEGNIHDKSQIEKLVSEFKRVEIEIDTLCRKQAAIV